jgi:hypothetical protein
MQIMAILTGAIYRFATTFVARVYLINLGLLLANVSLVTSKLQGWDIRPECKVPVAGCGNHLAGAKALNYRDLRPD